ncbi:HipA-like C-terminal domain [Actinomyces bovis]|uniref:HipA-like C-terminal domain n=1 Tax=Actinomyces bovis TaxID=1658 RepID=A0ABY1VL67_9ACTO|nr:HipA domain-containing protein [Actinomyces bovis]SPT52849.1 HipA-like C-terminal domain [Actinomyces bovis]VEG54938.1 HipA-like C-terminal domain [Actinomyces israelii]
MTTVEVFDRVIASVALGNTDDHLRKHGFFA